MSKALKKSKTEEKKEIGNLFVTNFIIRKQRQTLSLIWLLLILKLLPTNKVSKYYNFIHIADLH